MPRRKPAKERLPTTTHTLIIDTPHAMWDKLAWDIDVFDDLQRDRAHVDGEIQPLAYSFINACITAASLGDWLERGKPKIDRQTIDENVPGQASCRAIAGTAKHRHHEERDWAGGKVDRIYWEPDEDDPGGWIIYHSNGQARQTAMLFFSELQKDWWEFLRLNGLVEDRTMPCPPWQQIKLNRIFGPQ